MFGDGFELINFFIRILSLTSIDQVKMCKLEHSYRVRDITLACKVVKSRTLNFILFNCRRKLMENNMVIQIIRPSNFAWLQKPIRKGKKMNRKGDSPVLHHTNNLVSMMNEINDSYLRFSVPCSDLGVPW